MNTVPADVLYSIILYLQPVTSNLNIQPMYKIILCLSFFLFIQYGFAQSIPYGNNPETGKYLTVGDTKIYYEVYGKGEPLLLLHGGVYGYIDEFEYLIPKLAEKFQVIAVATRGHGKSYIG